MESTISERLRIIIDSKGLSSRAFAEKLNISQQVIFNYLRGRDPSYSTLQAIATTFVDINIDWLITGNGDMLKSESGRSYIDPLKIGQLLNEDNTANKSDIAKRIQKVIRTSQLSNQQFAEKAGINVGILSSILSGHRPTDINMHNKICTLFNINLDWLITGNGSMLKSDQPASIDPTLIAELKEEINDLKSENNQLKGENKILRELAGLAERKESKSKSA